jgi:hypothetical protein
MVSSEDVGSSIPAWKNPSRMCGCKWDLLKVRKGNTKGVQVAEQRAFPLQVLLKPTLTHGRADPGDSHPINE